MTSHRSLSTFLSPAIYAICMRWHRISRCIIMRRRRRDRAPRRFARTRLRSKARPIPIASIPLLTPTALITTISINRITIITFLTQVLIPNTVSTLSRCGPSRHDVRDTETAIAELCRPGVSGVFGDSEGLEVWWETDEGLVDAAGPVGEVVVCQCGECRRGGHDVDVVEAGYSAHCEVAEVGELCWLAKQLQLISCRWKLS